MTIATNQMQSIVEKHMCRKVATYPFLNQHFDAVLKMFLVTFERFHVVTLLILFMRPSVHYASLFGDLYVYKCKLNSVYIIPFCPAQVLIFIGRIP